jgi:hypothetical protein
MHACLLMASHLINSWNLCSSRSSNKERGRQLAAAGHARAALDLYSKALEATPQMARVWIEVRCATSWPHQVVNVSRSALRGTC